MLRVSRPLALLLLPLALWACGGARAGGSGTAPAAAQGAAPRRPLAGFAARPMIVLPAQRVVADETGWRAAAGGDTAWLATLDDEIAFAVGGRGTRPGWVFATDLARLARRNPTLADDPHGLPVDALLRDALEVPDPLASRLRALVALGGSRYALVPVAARFARVGADSGVAALRVVLVDTRAEQRVWSGEVRSDPSPTFTRALAASVAEHLADLIAAP